ncbi:MAG: polysaccharide biosynthesis tyrosine autokinase [Candidatus Omnitrophica bacterium]|nr:polysaccharide biosynthesis tyrosine autokinase [Candidatus Omnitrophota bacterium]MDD5430532.1 polysaccharide biosynthesis tyrosine autokinase [Candidatus Omnitrophota bacterium]
MIASNTEELSFKDYCEVIKKHIWLIIGIVIPISALVFFYSLVATKIYRAQTTLAIESSDVDLSERVNDVYKEEKGSQEYFQTQINILQSRSLAERVMEALNLNNNPEFKDTLNPAGKLLSMIGVKQMRSSNIVTLSVTGPDPVLITRIANSIVREFIQQSVERSSQAAQYGVSWLESQISGTMEELQISERELNEFIAKNKIVAVPDVESDKETLIESLKNQRAQLEKEVTEASRKYKDKHPKMIALETKLAKVNEQLETEVEKFIVLQKEITEYRIIKRRVDTLNSLYKDLLSRAKELDVSKEIAISNIRVVDPAKEPGSPIRPNLPMDVGLGFVVSLFLSIAISFIIEGFDTTIKTSDDIEFHVKTPFLGYIPFTKKELTGEEIFLGVDKKPNSIFAESFRNLRASLIFSFPEDKPLKSFAITSTFPQEGKSLISANLSIAFAQLGEPTLLIDADMRRGKLAEKLNIKNEYGLSSALTGTASLDKVIASTPVKNLDFISTGPYVPNPTELLNSDSFKNILKELQGKYKRVIIDSTPLLSISEAVILGDRCDGLVFVIKANSTPLKYVNEAKKVIGKKTKIIGTVLNCVEFERDHKYKYSYYYSESKQGK